ALVDRRYLVVKKRFLMRLGGLFDRQERFQGGHSPSPVGGERPAVHDRIVECFYASVAPVLPPAPELDLVHILFPIRREADGGHASHSLTDACDQRPPHNPPHRWPRWLGLVASGARPTVAFVARGPLLPASVRRRAQFTPRLRVIRRIH